MEPSDWINLIAAIIVGGGTLFLGIMAWRTIRQTKSIQKAEKRERLLNEIIEWAEDIFMCGRVPDMVYLTIVERAQGIPEALGRDMSDYVKHRFNAIKVRSIYIGKIALNFSEDLRRAVEQTIVCLDQQVKVLQLVSDGKGKWEAVGTHRKILDRCAKIVVEEAAKIKTRDIG
jgi:hypothetical protein